jgi:hypothetical protein
MFCHEKSHSMVHKISSYSSIYKKGGTGVVQKAKNAKANIR